MGMVNQFPNDKSLVQAYTVDRLSTMIVSVMEAIGDDEEIFKLLYYTNDNSLGVNLAKDAKGKQAFEKKQIYKHGNAEQRIEPYPFSLTLQTSHECFVRCYFNQGNLEDSEYWVKSQMHIDIICSHGLWLTSDKAKKIKVVRPYAILSRIMNILRDSDKENKLPQPTGYQHFTVNEKFECIRLYANTTSVEDGTEDLMSISYE